MTSTENYKKKLIEVAIPLEAISAGSAYEKMPGIGPHPRGIHHWWARRPHVACRSFLFAQLVDDPSAHPERFPTEIEQNAERQRLFDIIIKLADWKNSNNEKLFSSALDEIRNSCIGDLPLIHDPFAGGCSIPSEAQRLGLRAVGSDLNPVAVMIGKAMIEIPSRFAGNSPIHPGAPDRNTYRGNEGLAEDVRYFGEWMRQRAVEKLPNLYPLAELPAELGGGSANVIAWIWARTVPSPDPAFQDVQVPIASSFVLCNKKGKETHIRPDVDRHKRTINYEVVRKSTKSQLEAAQNGSKSGRGANFVCLLSGAAITPEYIKSVAERQGLGSVLIAMVADGRNSRVYLSPDPVHQRLALEVPVGFKPDQLISADRRAFTPPDYGMGTFGDLFTARQLAVLNTLSELLVDVRQEIVGLSKIQKSKDDARPLSEGGTGARAYAEAITMYLAFGIDRATDFNNSVVRWSPSNEKVMNLFGRQVIPIVWDYAEANMLGPFVGGFGTSVDYQSHCIERLPAGIAGTAFQHDAQSVNYQPNTVISTDPPYYDNIGYADLADFFYVWLRRNLKDIFPDLLSVLQTPKTDELIAAPYRHGGRKEAEDFFLEGMKVAIAKMAAGASDQYPLTIYYAFKQAEIATEGITSTGWATFLQAIVESGLCITATWPVRTEQTYRMRATGSNALANSVVLVCRRRSQDNAVISRAEFIRSLKRELPEAIADLQAANIAPADMPQSAIGPGMAVFSRYRSVLESNDSPMSVKTALQLINRELDEYLSGIQGEFDPDTRFSVTWFEQYGMAPGDYGTANNIAQARGISVESVKHAGIVESAAGQVRILNREELEPDWDPKSDSHLTIWECCQYLIRALESEGEHSAAMLLKKLGSDKADAVKDLAYCLYGICEKRADAKEATSYNALIAVWAELTRQAASIREINLDRQTQLDI